MLRDFVYFVRMDGATGQALTSSQGKARAPILFGLPTKMVADAAADILVRAKITPSGAGSFAVTVQQGSPSRY